MKKAPDFHKENAGATLGGVPSIIGFIAGAGQHPLRKFRSAHAAHCNVPAARRKAVQLLKALQLLERLATAANPCAGCRDNRPLPTALDIFDEWAVAGYVTRRTACNAVPAGEKPCLKGGAA